MDEVISLDEAIHLFEQYATESGGEYELSPRSVKQYKTQLKRFFRIISAVENLSNVEQKHIDNYLKYLRRNNKKRSYILTIGFALKTVFSMYQELGFISNNPCKEVDLKQGRRGRHNKEKKKNKSISTKDLYKILTTIDKSVDDKNRDRDWLIIALFYTTSFRNEELTSIEYDKIDFERKIITVRRKGGEIRDVVITELLKLPYKLQRNYLFGNSTEPLETDRCLLCKRHKLEVEKFENNVCGECDTNWEDEYPSIIKRLKKYCDTLELEENKKIFSISTRTVARIIDKWVKKSGLEIKITPHSLRHTFGTHMNIMDVSPFTIQQLMNHKDIKTTQIYVHDMNNDELFNLLRSKNIYKEELEDTENVTQE